MPHPILNIADVELSPWGRGGPSGPGLGQAPEGFQARMGEIGARIGSRKLGYGLTVLPPGKAAFPRHSHRVNEEMFFVLQGTGEAVIGDERHAIGPGDVIACPPGGPETAHQIVNTGEGELRFLAVSTMLSPEIVDYPDSGKFAVRMTEGAAERGGTVLFRHVGRAASGVDYWDGE